MPILAIDLGTQSIKCGIVDSEGAIQKLAQSKQEVYTPKPGWAQQQPERWWELTKDTIKILLEGLSEVRNQIQGIGVCGQMHGPVGVNPKLENDVTTEWTQIWMDKRCEGICNEVRNKHDELELAKITGNPITTGWPGFKIRWIKENQPDIYRNTKWFLVPKDFINYKLTGIAATDPSEASGTYLYDIESDMYSTKMAEILDLDLGKFAPIQPSYEVIGSIRDQIACELNLPQRIPVITGGADFIVSLLGLGMVGGGNAVDMTGTSTLFVVHKEKPIVNPSVQNLKHVLDGWLPFTILDTGGLSMKWCKDIFNTIKENLTYEELIELAKKAPIGSDGLLFYPYLLGERRKENVLAKGCFYGLSLNLTAGSIFRSVMEGVAIALGRDIANFKELGVNIDKIICVGGATKNKLLYKIKADVSQIPQVITDEPEASLRGIGLLTVYGLGLISEINTVFKDNNSVQTIIEPNPVNTSSYEKIQRKFNRMYDHMLGYWSD